jgi:hypothetical protein
MKRQPDGTFRGVKQPVKLSEVSIRARWIEAEILVAKDIGVSFEALAEHITQVGRGMKAPYITMPSNIVFLPDYSISRQAVYKTWVKAMSKIPALNAEQHRKLNNERSEKLWMYLQPGIRKCDTQAVNSAVKVLAHQAKLHGCYGLGKNGVEAVKNAKASIGDLLAEVGPIDDEESEKEAG